MAMTWLPVVALSVASIAMLGQDVAPQLQVTADRGEAEAALAILDTLATDAEPGQTAWQRLFATAGYRRLKQRETAMRRRFTDAEFAAFLRSPEAKAKTAGWREALSRWDVGMAGPAAEKALAYLPKGARLRATIFLTIKPKTNQFVFDLSGDPAIFLYLDPAVSPAKSANTMAHELHHIGLGAACAGGAEAPSAGVAALRPWIGAFGEGLAMLAAAGGADIHPHAVSTAEERAQWDAGIARFDQDFAEQDRYFSAVIEGRAGDEAAIEAKMRGYFGVQGPWYTVGWRMAQVIEQTLGRARTIDAFCRSETLLITYNAAAVIANRRQGSRLPLWDDVLAARLARGS